MASLGRTIVHDNWDNWLDFWLLKQLDFSDADFAIKMSIRPCNLAQITTMRDDTRAFINASCRDFLSVSPVGRNVTFLHRTVHDFLSSAEIQDLLNTNVPPIFQDPKFLVHIRLARCKVLLTTTEFGNEKCCFGTSQPPDTLNCYNDEDLVFPGSRALSEVFEATVQAFLSAREDVSGGHTRDRGCVFNQDWDEIYQFLAANGKVSVLFNMAATHDMQHSAAAIIDVARRFSRQSSTWGKPHEDERRKGKTAPTNGTRRINYPSIFNLAVRRSHRQIGNVLNEIQAPESR